MKYFFTNILLTLIVFTGCTPAKAPAATSNRSADTSLSINSFPVPDDIEGCGYYFASSELSFKSKEFLFVANFKGKGYVSVGHSLIQVRLDSSTRDLEKFGDHIYTYVGDNLRVTVEIRYTVDLGEESWISEGKIIVETKDGIKTARTYYGERGC